MVLGDVRVLFERPRLTPSVDVCFLPPVFSVRLLHGTVPDDVLLSRVGVAPFALAAVGAAFLLVARRLPSLP